MRLSFYFFNVHASLLSLLYSAEDCLCLCDVLPAYQLEDVTEDPILE